MNKFLKDLEAELKKNNLNEEEIEEIISDHKEMIESAIKEGLTEKQLEEKFGNPEEVAKELSQFTEKAKAKNKEETQDIIEFNNVKDNYDIEIGLINEDVQFEISDEEKIIVEYHGKRGLKDYRIVFEENKLELKAPKKQMGIFNFFDRNETRSFTITLPKKLSINTFGMKEVNGDLNIHDLKIKEFVMETTNGDVELTNLEIGALRTRTINGDLKLENITCEEYTSSLISGDIQIDNLKCEKDIYMSTVSGDIHIEDSSCNDAILKTVSGDLRGKEFYPKSLSLKSVSGDITIDNEDTSKEIEIKKKRTLSGDIRINRK